MHSRSNWLGQRLRFVTKSRVERRPSRRRQPQIANLEALEHLSPERLEARVLLATTAYVAPFGNDTTGNGSLEHPWASITKAAQAIPDDGGQVVVLDGTYGPQGISRSFSLPLTIRAENPYRAVLSSSTTVHRALMLYGAANFTLDGFEIEGQPGGTDDYLIQVTLSTAHDIVLQNNIIHDSYNNDILKINDLAHHITVRGNVFYNQPAIGGDEHIDINTVYDVTVEDNIFFNDYAASGRPVVDAAQSFIVIKNSGSQPVTQDITVRRNEFLNYHGAVRPALPAAGRGRPAILRGRRRPDREQPVPRQRQRPDVGGDRVEGGQERHHPGQHRPRPPAARLDVLGVRGAAGPRGVQPTQREHRYRQQRLLGPDRDDDEPVRGVPREHDQRDPAQQRLFQWREADPLRRDAGAELHQRPGCDPRRSRAAVRPLEGGAAELVGHQRPVRRRQRDDPGCLRPPGDVLRDAVGRSLRGARAADPTRMPVDDILGRPRGPRPDVGAVQLTSVTQQPPVAANDTYTTPQGTALTVAAPGVLANDSDPSGKPLTAALVAGPANGTLTLNSNGSFSYTPKAGFSGADSFTYRDSDGTLQSNTATVALTVTTSTSTRTTIFGTTATPTRQDEGPDSPVEVGVRFTSDVAGTITGIRFYKSSTNTGIHVGNLWSSTGTKLRSATFTGETASGWQQVSFATPVAIQANTVYVASYHTNVGHYAEDNGYFTTAHSNGSLHALADGASGPNGVYRYGSGSGFPTTGYLKSNYWVDVVFVPG